MKRTIYKAATKVEVRPAGDKGRGVFATNRIKEDELIEVSPALRLPRAESELASMTDLGHYMFQQTGGAALVGLGYTSMYNHSVDANCEYQASGKTIVIKAVRGIKSGEELTIDYGWDPEDGRDAKNSKASK